MKEIKIDLNNNELNVQIDNISNINNEITTNIIEINANATLQQNSSLINSNLNFNDKNLLSSIEKSELQETQNHAWLKNLDYENSGHIGFASKKELSVLVPKQLSVLQKTNLSNRNAKIYIDDNNVPSYTTINELLDLKMRTVTNIPDNMEYKDYIFLEESNNG